MLPSRIGPYPVEREVGRGGMGVVYRARDPRLDRPVAIKVLPDEFARDPERLARFEREARLLAALVHPNIAAIHGLEEAEGRRFLVLEYVDGQTLAERLAAGPLSVAETLDVGRQIAAALEAAHEAGIIHRDLKPGNVKLTPAGDVKVLDFGLARGADPAGADSSPDARNSPTLSFAATGAGVILGTAAYMSPEQARGKRLDRRTDIWSFGAVLYECLTGTQAFPGETVSDSIARILQGEPDPAPLPPDLPPRLRALLARCLEKDAKRRLRDIGDARIELEEMMGLSPASSRLGHDSSRIDFSPPPAAGTIATPRWRSFLPLFVAALAGAALAFFAVTALRPAGPPREPLRFTIDAPVGQRIPGDPCEFALSPDGRRLVFVATDSSGTPHLWLRPLDAFAAERLAGTEGALLPFWSPDGRSVAFFARLKLMRLTLGAGSPEAVCDAPNPRGGSWGAGDVIVFARSSGPIHRVDARGGAPSPVTAIDSTSGENAHRWPHFLPDGKHFLFVSLPLRSGKFDVWSGSIDGGGRERTPLLRAANAPIYSSGHLLYGLNARLVAQAFDAGKRRVRGEPFVVGDPPRRTTYTGAPAGSVSGSGVLAWTISRASPRRLSWLSLDGRLTPVPGLPERLWTTLVVSRDGRLALVDESLVGSGDLWLVDFERSQATRLDLGDGTHEVGAFLPDGRSFLYGSTRLGTRNFYRRRVDGVGGDSLVYRSAAPFKNVSEVTPDGSEFVFQQVSGDSAWDIYAARLETGAPRPIVATMAAELNPALSRDGRWLAWTSDESGANEIYVAAYPGLEGKHQVSRGTGTPGLWAPDGRAIWFGQPGGGKLLSAPFDPITGRAGLPREIATVPEGIISGQPTPDGRMLVIYAPPLGDLSISIAVDWLAGAQPAGPSAGRIRAR